MILILSVLIGYIRFLDSGRLRWIAISSGILAVAIFTHPAAVFVALFCIYLTWRRSGSVRRTASSAWPLVLVSLIFGLLAYLVSPHVNQVQGMVTAPDSFRLLKNLFWLMGRLVTSAHWLPSIALSDRPTFWEMATGLLACGGIVVLCLRKSFPAADWAVWSFLAILPFINHPPSDVRWLPVGPSRHLYFSSLGSSLVLAWALRSVVKQTGRWLNQESKQVAFGVLLVCLTAASIHASKSAEAVSFYLSGRSYIAREAYEKGIDLYKRAIARSPRVVPQDVFFRLGSALLGYGRFPRKMIEQGLARDPDSPRFGMLLGVSTFLQEDPEIRRKGEGRIRRALEAAKDQEQFRLDTARAFQNLAGYYHQSGRYQEAEDLYVKALYIQPNYPLVLFNLSKTLYIQGKTDKAIRILQAAAKLDPTGTRALWDLGTLLRAQDRLEEAAETYLQILQIDPDDLKARSHLQELTRNRISR